jgi:hypothetical protein
VLNSVDHVLGILEAPAVLLVGGDTHGSSRSTEWEEPIFGKRLSLVGCMCRDLLKSDR